MDQHVLLGYILPVYLLSYSWYVSYCTPENLPEYSSSMHCTWSNNMLFVCINKLIFKKNYKYKKYEFQLRSQGAIINLITCGFTRIIVNSFLQIQNEFLKIQNDFRFERLKKDQRITYWLYMMICFDLRKNNYKLD